LIDRTRRRRISLFLLESKELNTHIMRFGRDTQSSVYIKISSGCFCCAPQIKEWTERDASGGGGGEKIAVHSPLTGST